MLLRLLPVVALIVLVMTAGCGDDDDQTFPSQSQTPADSLRTTVTTLTPSPPITPSRRPSVTLGPSPTAVGIAPDGFDAFAAFAPEIEAAVADADGEFFASRVLEIETTCMGDEQLGPCSDQPAGKVIRGLPGFAWHSDASAVIPKQDYAEFVEDWFNEALAGESDERGSGSPMLRALAWNSEAGEYYALATLIRDTGPATGIRRQARIFRFTAGAQGEWALVGEILASDNNWLSGSCGECYDYWQPWPE